MDPLVALLVVVVSILSILLVIVGVQVILILKQFKETLSHVNGTLKEVDDIVALISHPLEGLGDTLAGIKSGLKFAETFVSWLKDRENTPTLKKGS